MATKPHRRPGAGTVPRLPSGRWQARRTEADGAVRSIGTWLTRAEVERALAAAELEDLAGGRTSQPGTASARQTASASICAAFTSRPSLRAAGGGILALAEPSGLSRAGA